MNNRNSVGGKIDERLDSIKDSVRSIVGNAENRASDIKKRAVDVKNDAMSKGHDALDRATDFIKANPLKSVGIAFGVGYIGMRIFRR